MKFERSPIFFGTFFKIENVLLCNSVIMMLLLSDLGKSFATLFPRAKDVQNWQEKHTQCIINSFYLIRKIKLVSKNRKLVWKRLLILSLNKTCGVTATFNNKLHLFYKRVHTPAVVHLEWYVVCYYFNQSLG